MLKMKLALAFLAMLFVTTACNLDKKDGTTTSIDTGNSSPAYRDLSNRYNNLVNSNNTLVGKYNALLTSSHAGQLASQDEARYLLELDTELESFSRSADLFFNAYLTVATLTDKQKIDADAVFRLLQTRQESALIVLGKLETNLLVQIDALDANVDAVYQNPQPNHEQIAGFKKLLLAKGNQLVGVRSLLNTHAAQLRSRYTMVLTASKLPPPEAAKPIVLRPEEKPVANVGGGSGVVRGDDGKVEVFKDEAAIVDYAGNHNFSRPAASAAYRMSSPTGGLMTFAADGKKLTQSAIDMFSHMKTKMNTNTDGLEVVFVLDYSGSMSNKIKSVIEGLVQMVDSLDNIKVTGRDIKIAITTFGYPGKEKIDLDLTQNLASVSTKLRDLLKDYPTAQHSVDPGEASYNGLKKAVDGISWKSANRMAIVITDEPAWELELAQDADIRAAQAA